LTGTQFPQEKTAFINQKIPVRTVNMNKKSTIGLVILLAAVLIFVAAMLICCGEKANAPSGDRTDEDITQVTSEERDSDDVTQPIESQDKGTEDQSSEQDPVESDTEEDPSNDLTQDSDEIESEEQGEDTLPETDSELSTVAPQHLLYEEYMELTAEEQILYFNSFSSVEDFFAWFNAAKEDYAIRNPGIDIDPEGGFVPIP
jgi:type IV secretory pathway VirB10-like protein